MIARTQELTSHIIEQISQNINKPEDILHSLLLECRQPSARPHAGAGMFADKSKAETGRLMDLLLKAGALDPQNPMRRILHILNKEQAAITPGSELSILLGAFFSVFDYYRGAMSPALMEKLTHTDAWNAMISARTGNFIAKFKNAKLNHEIMAELDCYQEWVPDDRRSQLAIALAESIIKWSDGYFVNFSVLAKMRDWIPAANRPALIEALLDKTGHADRYVRESSLEALDTLKDWLDDSQKQRLIAILLAGIQDHDYCIYWTCLDVLSQSISELSETRQKEVVDRLAVVLQAEEPFIRSSVLDVLERMAAFVPQTVKDEVIHAAITALDTSSRDSGINDRRAKAYFILKQWQAYVDRKLHGACMDKLTTRLDQGEFLEFTNAVCDALYAFRDSLDEPGSQRLLDVLNENYLLATSAKYYDTEISDPCLGAIALYRDFPFTNKKSARCLEEIITGRMERVRQLNTGDLSVKEILQEFGMCIVELTKLIKLYEPNSVLAKKIMEVLCGVFHAKHKDELKYAFMTALKPVYDYMPPSEQAAYKAEMFAALTHADEKVRELALFIVADLFPCCLTAQKLVDVLASQKFNITDSIMLFNSIAGQLSLKDKVILLAKLSKTFVEHGDNLVNTTLFIKTWRSYQADIAKKTLDTLAVNTEPVLPGEVTGMIMRYC